ncbi:MAG: ribosome maturation factor RimP [Holdemania filiformis]
MEQLENIKTLILPVLDSLAFSFTIEMGERKEIRILQIAVMRAESMDIDTCALVSEKISEALDAHDDWISFEYFLEVCSPGAERELRNAGEIRGAPGKHVCVRLKSPVKSMMEITGDLLEMNETTLTLSYRDKAVTRKAQVELDQIEKIRLAVKL